MTQLLDILRLKGRTLRRLATSVLLAGCFVPYALHATGCVETADCDQSSPCPQPDAEVCYNFRCLPRCTLEDLSCETGRECKPCQESCQGDEGYACVSTFGQ